MLQETGGPGCPAVSPGAVACPGTVAGLDVALHLLPGCRNMLSPGEEAGRRRRAGKRGVFGVGRGYPGQEDAEPPGDLSLTSDHNCGHGRHGGEQLQRSNRHCWQGAAGDRKGDTFPTLPVPSMLVRSLASFLQLATFVATSVFQQSNHEISAADLHRLVRRQRTACPRSSPARE